MPLPQPFSPAGAVGKTSSDAWGRAGSNGLNSNCWCLYILLLILIMFLCPSDWREFRELTDAGRVTYVIAMDLFLSPGHTYRAVVQFCHQDGCFLVSQNF